MLNEIGKCPICSFNWCGGDIPEESRNYYTPPYKWSHLIGIEFQGTYDGIIMSKCPNCLSIWLRFTDKLLYIGSGEEPASEQIKEINLEAIKELKAWFKRSTNEAN